jgi:hypothetical protein
MRLFRHNIRPDGKFCSLMIKELALTKLEG